MTAVSSNTSIMSEVSNISKSSLPSSIPTSNAMRNASICSSTSSVRITNQISATQAIMNRQNSLSLQKPAPAPSEPKTSTTSRLASNSSKQLQHLQSNQLSRSQVNILNSTVDSKLSTSSAFKKPGLLLNNQNQSSQGEFVKPLLINTGLKAESVLSLTSPASSTSSVNAKNKEIKRLEALCESRTKELSMLKMKLKQSLTSFDAMAVAFNYLSNDVIFFKFTDKNI